jgi:hypothetical protein
MNIVGLDIATRLTGWTAGDGRTRPRLDAMRFPFVGDDYGLLIDLFDQNLCVLVETFKPVAVIYEGPILVVNRKKKRGDQWTTEIGLGHNGGPEMETGASHTDTPMVLRKIYGMGTHLEFFCRRRGIECSEVTLQAIKKEVTGNHMAPKEDVVAVARKCGLDLPTGPAAKDAADAWGAWLLGLRHYSPEMSRRWDSLIWSPRGSLL